MNKYHYKQKLEAYTLLTSSSAFVANEGFIKTKSADTIDLATVTSKHKTRTEKVRSNGRESAEIEVETQKSKQALDKMDAQEDKAILQGVSTKLDNLTTKSPRWGLAAENVETNLAGIERNKTNRRRHRLTEDRPKHGKLQVKDRPKAPKNAIEWIGHPVKKVENAIVFRFCQLTSLPD